MKCPLVVHKTHDTYGVTILQLGSRGHRYASTAHVSQSVGLQKPAIKFLTSIWTRKNKKKIFLKTTPTYCETSKKIRRLFNVNFDVYSPILQNEYARIIFISAQADNVQARELRTRKRHKRRDRFCNCRVINTCKS